MTKKQLLDCLEKEFNSNDILNDFSREEAIYWYCSDYHTGQGSDLYSILCQSDYKPSPLLKGIEGCDIDSQMVYDALVDMFEN